MKYRILGVMLAVTMVISGFCGLKMPVNAEETGTTAYSFSNTNTTASSEWRSKTTDKKIYIHPTSGPKIYYTIQGSVGGGASTVANRSNTVAIPTGTEGSVTNYVYENGENQARLVYTRISYAYATTSGVWKPDPSGTYTIYN